MLYATSLCWLSILTALCICTGSVTAIGHNPGVRARITRKGLDYVSEVAVDMLMAKKDEIQLSDMHVSVAGSSMVLSNMVIKHLPRPTVRLYLLPNNSSPIGRLRVDVKQLHPIVDANMRISYRSWLFSSSRQGSVTTTGRNIMIQLMAALDVNDAGRLLPRELQCQANGNVQIELTGRFRRWSRLFGLVYNTLESQLKPTIFRELCVNVLRDVNRFISNALVNLPMSVDLDDDFVFDYRLTRPPRITRQFIETCHKGTIYLKSNTTEPPFVASVIPEFAAQTDKMVTLYVTDYVLNSGWYAMLTNGHQITVQQNTTSVPEAARRFLSTSCPGSSCLGSVFPRLARLYPNSSATVNIHVSNTSQQVFSLRGRSLHSRTEAVAETIIETARSRDHILTANLTALCDMNLRFTGNKLVSHVTKFDLKADVQRNSLGLIMSFTEILLDSFIGMVSRMVILPTLQMIGLQGVPLIVPMVPELKLINPVVIDHNLPGMVVVSTDIEYMMSANSTVRL